MASLDRVSPGPSIVERLLPRRLGANGRWLILAGWVTNLGDGIELAAGPLLMASQTHDPVLVSVAGMAQYVPRLLFGLYAGALSDRVDRRRLLIGANLARVAILALLVTTMLTGRLSPVVTVVALFAFGIAETFEDSPAGALLPTIVPPADLGLANARSMTGLVTLNQLAGPPIGAFLFATATALPFTATAITVALGAVLVSRIRLAPSPAREPSHLRTDVAQGFRWLWNHRPVRTLALTILSFNVTFGAAWSVLVLYALNRLQLGAVGFGLLTTAMALGGLIGTSLYGRLTARFSLGTIMRGGLVIETLTHLALALTTSAGVALAVMVVFGAHAFVWGTTSSTVRQRAVPIELQGRVGAVYMLAMVGGYVIGAALGGVIARQWGVTAPFWFGFVGSALILASIWRELVHIAHAPPPSAESR